MNFIDLFMLVSVVVVLVALDVHLWARLRRRERVGPDERTRSGPSGGPGSD